MLFNFEPNFIEKFLWESGFSDGNLLNLKVGKCVVYKDFEGWVLMCLALEPHGMKPA